MIPLKSCIYADRFETCEKVYTFSSRFWEVKTGQTVLKVSVNQKQQQMNLTVLML